MSLSHLAEFGKKQQHFAENFFPKFKEFLSLFQIFFYIYIFFFRRKNHPGENSSLSRIKEKKFKIKILEKEEKTFSSCVKEEKKEF